jgi:hypothetical protein
VKLEFSSKFTKVYFQWSFQALHEKKLLFESEIELTRGEYGKEKNRGIGKKLRLECPELKIYS